jgi:dihydropteroate synthase
MLDSRDKSTDFSINRSLKCGDNIISLDEPRIMGILNLTPDSFYDGGRYQQQDEFIEHVEKMLLEGADIIDIGAISTRPGAVEVTEITELDRLLPALRQLTRLFPTTVFSVDTYRSSVARIAVENGAGIINDISGSAMDEKMAETVGLLDVPYILMHMQGTPANMQINPVYSDVVAEISLFFRDKSAELSNSGVKQIILDPGFGFGKTLAHNYSILKNLDHFKSLDLPILVGLSRKSMINKLLNISADNALNATGVLHTFALLKGADILRVHDVKEAKEVIKVVKAYQNAGD